MNVVAAVRALDPRKFQDPQRTAAGEVRARVALASLDTLWINTGTLCNVACAGCYIESSPKNDRLSYITAAEVRPYLDEAKRDWNVREIGFTGGEPFMNREFMDMVEDALARGFRVLILTNAMKPMAHGKPRLAALGGDDRARVSVRVSLDHYTERGHEELRGPRSWTPAIEGLQWLAAQGFALAVAGRTCWREPEAELRSGYAALFARLSLPIDASDPSALVLFPEMDAAQDVPEITEKCWGVLNRDPESVMCAHSRMVVKRKGAARPAVLACTLVAYDARFEMGATLAEAAGPIALNHPHCARFCVLGGASCSPG